ncbi:MAG: hypothetical protein NTV46_08025 [Verrucomicrobia bacterium]|nr:hypothetical protein [Verrucomicrobiota bacterium]
MHRLKSTSTVHRFRFAALLLCTKCVLAPVAGAVLLLALITGNHPLALTGGTLVGLTGLNAFLQWLIATRTGCPLCMTPVLARKQCVTHRHARAFLGSHRLRVALTILLRSRFQCPYCAEFTVIKARHRNRPD